MEKTILESVKNELVEVISYALIEGCSYVQFNDVFETEKYNMISEYLNAEEIKVLNDLRSHDIVDIKLAVLEQALDYYDQHANLDDVCLDETNKDYHNIIVNVSPSQKVYEEYLNKMVLR